MFWLSVAAWVVVISTLAAVIWWLFSHRPSRKKD